MSKTIDEISLKNKLIMGKSKVLPKEFKFTHPNNVGSQIGYVVRKDD
jgi:hypothetical protein